LKLKDVGALELAETEKLKSEVERLKAEAKLAEERAENLANLLAEKLSKTKEGTLLKKMSGVLGVRSSYKPRHIRLTPTGDFLWSSLSSDEKEHRGFVSLSDSGGSVSSTDPSAGQDFTFELNAGGRTIAFAAETEVERDEWIKVISAWQ